VAIRKSLAAFEFCHQYLQLLKQLNGSPYAVNHRKYIKDFLIATISKMKFDEEYDFENESDEEAEFQDFRKQMKVLLNSIAKLEGVMVINAINEILTVSFSNWQNMPFKDVEVAVYTLYCLGECFTGQNLYTDPGMFETFQCMMTLLINSNVSQYPHSAVKLQYFETVTRWERFFYAQTQHIPTVLVSFLDERGLRNSDGAIRSRTSFLLTRFVKSLKNQVHPFVDDILARLRGLLINTDKDQTDSLAISVNDRNFLYEVAAILITVSNTGQEKQLLMMQTLFTPLIAVFQQNLSLIGAG
jgi:exportin-T